MGDDGDGYSVLLRGWRCVGVCGVLLSDASSAGCLGAGWLALAVLIL